MELYEMVCHILFIICHIMDGIVNFFLPKSLSYQVN